MKNLFTTLMIVILMPAAAWAGGNAIKISAGQLAHLDIHLGKAALVKHVPILSAPAIIVIPPGGEYVVSSPQSGLVNRLLAATGDPVEKGQVLAELNSSGLLTLQQHYLSANSELHVQQLAYERDKKLYEEGIIARRRWLETRSLYQAGAYAANERRQLLAIAGMTESEIGQLTKTHKLSGLLHVRAPISGVVLERLALPGERVDSVAPLYRISDLRELWLEINIPQERLGEIKLGDTVLLEKAIADTPPLERRQAPATMPFKAEVTLLGQNVNPENQTILARAVIRGEPQDVRPGQRLNVQIIQDHSSPAYRVPNTAVAQHEGNAYVFIRNEEGFVAEPIRIIGKQDHDTTFSGELTGQEEIAVNGAVALKAIWLGLGGDD